MENPPASYTPDTADLVTLTQERKQALRKEYESLQASLPIKLPEDKALQTVLKNYARIKEIRKIFDAAGCIEDLKQN